MVGKLGSYFRSHPTATFLFFFLFPSLLSAQTLQTKTTNFDAFNNPNEVSLSFLGESRASQGALQLTPDTRNNVSYLQNQSGRVILNQPYKLWDDKATTPLPLLPNTTTNGSASSSQKLVASFNTTFDMNIFRDVDVTVVGEGLAFAIFPDLSPPPPGSHGGFLGLTNSTLDGNPSNHFIAVEFDTFQQSYDPDDNHVGLNINGVKSNVSVPLNSSGIILSPINATKYTVWIDYSGPLSRISVYIALQSAPKPKTPVLNWSLDLSEHLSSTSYFGFSGSTGDKYELNCILRWNLVVDILPVDKDPEVLAWFLKAGLPILVSLIIIVVIILGVCLHKKRETGDVRLGDTLKSLPGMAKEFEFKDLKVATGNFDERNRLGKGGFGVVYKGRLPREDTEVAVKTFSRESCQGDFLAELTIINRLRHKNLVRLLGWCYKNGKLLLVYEYMPNGSLDRHLFNEPEEGILQWFRRYHILAGVASALQYLHNEYDQKVVHRDLKASNIMLDSNFNGRLGDFGLARTIDNERTSYAELELNGMPGTWGYIAPECLHTGKATRESDVFGFGAVVLEVVCGRSPGMEVKGYRVLSDWVWSLYREGRIVEAVDPRLGDDYVKEEAERLLLLGLACSHPDSAERPKTQAIVQIISKSVPPPPVPPTKPSFVWPAFPSDSETSTTMGNGSSPAGFSSKVSSSYYNVSVIEMTPQFLSKEDHTNGTVANMV